MNWRRMKALSAAAGGPRSRAGASQKSLALLSRARHQNFPEAQETGKFIAGCDADANSSQTPHLLLHYLSIGIFSRRQ